MKTEIRKIDEELSNSYIYAQAEDSSNPNTNFYYFKQKGITKNDYNESLISIKKLIDEIFIDIPSINIFDFVTITKKGKFSKNRIIHLATPIVGLICKNSYYTCIKYFALEVNTINEDLAEMSWNFVECDPKKFETLFFKLHLLLFNCLTDTDKIPDALLNSLRRDAMLLIVLHLNLTTSVGFIQSNPHGIRNHIRIHDDTALSVTGCTSHGLYQGGCTT